jgi:hypothetical protein
MNHSQAFTLALKLALTAPDDEASEKATKLAEEIGANLDELAIARCKREALLDLGMIRP